MKKRLNLHEVSEILVNASVLLCFVDRAQPQYEADKSKILALRFLGALRDR